MDVLSKLAERIKVTSALGIGVSVLTAFLVTLYQEVHTVSIAGIALLIILVAMWLIVRTYDRFIGPTYDRREPSPEGGELGSETESASSTVTG